MIMKCKYCDVQMNLHKFPKEKLICHQCWKEEDIPHICPMCKWTNLIWVWVWTQKIEDRLSKIFKTKIIRLDSDKLIKEWINLKDIETSQIIIATQMINSIPIENLWLVAFPLFENELFISEYDIEEKMFYNITINKKRGADIIIQTFSPKNNLLDIIINWNYNDFLKYTLKEREQFKYPPYVDMAIISIRSESKEKINHLSISLMNKLEYLNEENKFIINFKEDRIIKIWKDYKKTILIRWEWLEEFLKNIEIEILKNREISLEWK